MSGMLRGTASAAHRINIAARAPFGATHSWKTEDASSSAPCKLWPCNAILVGAMGMAAFLGHGPNKLKAQYRHVKKVYYDIQAIFGV